jgi:hypothetical protein
LPPRPSRAISAKTAQRRNVSLGGSIRRPSGAIHVLHVTQPCKRRLAKASIFMRGWLHSEHRLYQPVSPARPIRHIYDTPAFLYKNSVFHPRHSA